MAADCVFCKIVAGEIPSTKVYEDEHSYAFADTNPQAPTHVLVVTKKHLTDIADAGGDPEAAAGLLAGIRGLAKQENLRDFRTVFNTGDNAIAVRLFEELLELIKSGQNLTADSVTRAYGILTAATGERPAEVLSLNILSRRGKNIRPKTLNQKRYVDAIDKNTITFGIGPAGTGKTYLAVAKAVQSLLGKEVNRIILTRPAVEAGERLGFLPGTLFEKIDPYLRPLFDALHDMLDPDSLPRLMQAGTIEIAPLAYMRGRRLNDAFIILDEAQNTTSEQMKMFLTRLGFGSKIVVTGDVTQVDLPGDTRSGLKVVRDILGDVEDVHFANLTSTDVVRHRLVGHIVDAYERYDRSSQQGPSERPQRAKPRR